MIGMVFIIFADGTTTLFIKNVHIPKGNAFNWVTITNINQLKLIVGEMIVISFREVSRVDTPQRKGPPVRNAGPSCGNRTAGARVEVLGPGS